MKTRVRTALWMATTALLLTFPALGDDVEDVHRMLDRIEKAWETHDITALTAECAETGLAIVNAPGRAEGAVVMTNRQALDAIPRNWSEVKAHKFIERNLKIQDGFAWMQLLLSDDLGQRRTRVARVLNAAIRQGNQWKVCFSMPGIARPVVFVAEVIAGQEGDRQGFKAGDVVVSYDGQGLADAASLIAATKASAGQTGHKIPVLVRRKDQEIRIEVAPGTLGLKVADRIVPAEGAVLLEPDQPHPIRDVALEGLKSLITSDADRACKTLSPGGFIALVPAHQDKQATLVTGDALPKLFTEAMQETRKTFDLATAEARDQRIVVLGDVAVLTGKFQVAKREGGGKALYPSQLEVYVRQNGQWGLAATLPFRVEAGLHTAARGPTVEKREIESRVSGRKAGVGVNIEAVADGLRIVHVLPESPGAKAGLKPGEIITEIDARPAKGLTVQDAAGQITGDEGTPVMLTLRSVGGEERKLTVTRAMYSLPAPQCRMLGNGIALIRIAEFNRETPGAVRKAFAEAEKAGVRGIILDLRGNQSGLVDACRDVARIFLPKGKLLWIQQTQGGRPKPIRTTTDAEYQRPVVVLISEETVGSGELLASALKQNGRAVLLGRKTSGAVRIRSVSTRPDGSSELVDAGTFLAAPRTPLTGVGVAPDVELSADLTEEKVIEQAAGRLADPGR